MNSTNRVFQYILAYTLFLATLALALISAMILRETIFEINVLVGLHRYTVHAINQFVTFGLGIVLMAILIVGEHQYRTGVEKRRLWPRFCWLTGYIIGIIGGLHVIHLIFQAVNGGIQDPMRVVLTALEVAAALGLLWWRRKLLENRQLSRRPA